MRTSQSRLPLSSFYLVPLFVAACGDPAGGETDISLASGGASESLMDGSGAALGSGGSAEVGSGGQSNLGSGGEPFQASSSGGAANTGGTDGGGSMASGGIGSGGVGQVGTGGGGSTEPFIGTLVPDPSWDCGLPSGIPHPEQGELIFTATLDVNTVRDLGRTQYGQRRAIDFGGGQATGPMFDGSILEGSLDFELTLSNGAMEFEQVHMLRASNGTLVYVRTCGVAAPDGGAPRIVFDFEAPNSSNLAFLNSGTFVGTRVLDETSKKMEMKVFDVSSVDNADTLTLSDPESDLDQPWDCLVLDGQNGAQVITETVQIGSSLSVGESKRGSRNVIPITGGSVTGKLNGSVVSAGADYQLIGGSTILDARYLLESNDGETVIVRNCGPFGGLVPLFEARSDGPYSFFNENRFLSSDPGVGNGAVTITFYELQ